MIACEICDGEMPEDATVCPHCGTRRGAAGDADHRWIRIVIFALLLAAVMVSWAWSTGFTVRPN